jgi:agmatinase
VNDDQSGFKRIEAREIDTIGTWRHGRMRERLISSRENTGTAGIIKKIRDTVGDKPVYLSIDVRCHHETC